MKTEFWIIEVWGFQYIILNPRFGEKYLSADAYIPLPIRGKEKGFLMTTGIGAFNYSEMTKLERV